jgi:16S rRNA (guanine(966)-N(2))-methyltransferase RsmD
MRIVSGTLRGRRLNPPSNLPVRPTTDFAKESLFNVLNNMIDFESVHVLDLFSGTGSISFEFISRGALQVISVDSNARCVDFIRKTSLAWDIPNLETVRADVFRFLNHAWKKVDIIFADPPYDLPDINKIPDLVSGSGILQPSGLFILEHGSRHTFRDHPLFTQQRQYGSVNFTIFKISSDTSD